MNWHNLAEHMGPIVIAAYVGYRAGFRRGFRWYEGMRLLVTHNERSEGK
jgi:hypothetical protein